MGKRTSRRGGESLGATPATKTLPIWIFQSFRLANQLPLVNVAGVVAILLSVVPVYLATRLSSSVVGARS